MSAQTYTYTTYNEDIGFDEINNHTPNSFVIDKEIQNLREKLITEEGLRNNLLTLLEERAQMAVSKFDISLRDGKLYSLDFEIPLTELYAKPCGDPIYDMRAPFDTQYIRQVEEWANGTLEDFSWIRFSPTTGAMSKETKIEFGVRSGAHLHTYVITLPFRDNQTKEQAFEEIKQLAGRFNPNFRKAKNEFDLLPCPVITKGTKSIEEIMFYLDQELTSITKVPYFMGRPKKTYNHYEVTQFQKFIKAIDDKNLIEYYITACKLGDPKIAQAIFNNIVNNFDLFWSEGQPNTKNNVAEIINAFIHDESDPKIIAAGCGAAGGKKSGGITKVDLAFYRGVLQSMGIHVTEKMTDPVLCDDCGKVFFVDNDDPDTWWDFCPHCHSDCVSCVTTS
jgi:hypothetical protein